MTPWDPTPEALKWFTDLTEKYEVTGQRHGLVYVDQLAAKYEDVVDTYLHGGATRIAQAYQAVAALDRVDGSSGTLDLQDVVRRIQNALPTLDTDPHYRYELRFGEGRPEGAPQRPGIVMTSIIGEGAAGQWAAVDVIARCAASEQVRPITFRGRFVVAKDDPFTGTLHDFREFGVPFTSPEGALEGEIDAPGGLGGRLEGGVVTLLAISGDVGDNPDLHLEALDPSGAVLASIDLVRIERSDGTSGVRVVLEELNGIFTIEDLGLGRCAGDRDALGAIQRPRTLRKATQVSHAQPDPRRQDRSDTTAMKPSLDGLGRSWRNRRVHWFGRDRWHDPGAGGSGDAVHDVEGVGREAGWAAHLLRRPGRGP